MYATAITGHTFLNMIIKVVRLHTVLGQELYSHDLYLLPG